MRTIGREPPDAPTPWNEIVPLLWMGRHHHGTPDGSRVLTTPDP